MDYIVIEREAILLTTGDCECTEAAIGGQFQQNIVQAQQQNHLVNANRRELQTAFQCLKLVKIPLVVGIGGLAGYVDNSD